MKQLTRDYFNRHPFAQISAQRFLFSMLCYPGFEGKVSGMMAENNENEKNAILQENDINRLMRMLRNSFGPGARELLRSKLLEKEEEMLPLLFQDLPKAFKDSFVENAVHLLVECKANSCDQIIAMFDSFRYPYTASALCLVLGFRGDPSMIPFLMEKVDMFERMYPNDTFSQGPLLSLYHLKERFDHR